MQAAWLFQWMAQPACKAHSKEVLSSQASMKLWLTKLRLSVLTNLKQQGKASAVQLKQLWWSC